MKGDCKSSFPVAAAVRGALAALTLALAACDSAEERAEKHFARGKDLVAEGESGKAQLEFRNVLRLDREHAGARFELGKLAEQNGNLRNAVGNFRQVAEADPTHVEARLKLAQYLLLGGVFDEARDYAVEALALEPQNIEAILAKAAIDFRLGDRAAALDGARSATAIEPGNPGANILILTDLAERDGPASALPQLDALLEAQPMEESLHLFKARLLEASGDQDALVAHLEHMIDLFPEQIPLRRGLVELRLARGEPELAEGALREIVDAQPENAELALDLVRLIARTRGVEDARAELRARAAAAPDGDAAMSLRLALVDLLQQTDGVDAARSELQAAIAQAAGRAQADRARLRLAQIELSEGDKEAAAAIVAQVLEGDAENVDGLALRAALRLDALDIDGAIVDLRRALGLDPENPRLLLLEAQAHQLDGNPALAGERLSAAARITNHAPAYALRYAAHLRSQNQGSAAAAALEESVRRNPGDRALLTELAEVHLQLGDTSAAQRIATQLRDLRDGGAVADQVSAAVLARQGDLQQSIEMLEQIASDPRNEGAGLASLVAGYLQAGEKDRAVRLLDDLTAQNPANVQAQILRAELHLRDGEQTLAEQRLKALLAAVPDDPVSYIAATRFYLQLGRIEDVERLAREGVAAAPDALATQTLRLTLANIHELRGEFEAAISEYRTLYETSPNSLVVANNLASLLAEYRADDAEALSFAQQVARRLRNSDVPHFRDTYGWIAFLTGDVDEALRSLIPAAEALPGNALVLYHLGRAYAAAGQNDLAREKLEAALAVEADFPKADSARAALAGLPGDG